MTRYVYLGGRWLTAEAAYEAEHGPETLLKYLEPRSEPDAGAPLRLFEPDPGRKPTEAELYEEACRRE